MVQKRPLDDEQVFVSFKHPRQVGHSKELVSFSESVFTRDVSRMPQTLDDGLEKCNTGGVEKVSGDVFGDLPKVAEDIKTGEPGSFTISAWTTSSTREEDSIPQAPYCGSFFPEYFNLDHPTRTLASEDIYSFLLDHPPRKSASIGPEHQAVVPPWGGHNDVSDNSDLENEERLMGTCVIPMPDSEIPSDSGYLVGKGRTECSCEDRASVRCVRQHIVEARENLIKTIGPERAVELGLCDMGEQVADRWSEEEEQLFHQVVFSNPASLDKNFWDILSAVFASRTKREIVSYYFNVFMLRKRARQNRYDPVNVDSDNDEWEGSNVHGDDDQEDDNDPEDDDSVVDSPGCQDDSGYNRRWGVDVQEYEEDAVDNTCGRNVVVDIYGGSTKQISDKCPGSLVDNGSSRPQFHKSIAWDETGDQEAQDDSCTSFEAGVASQDNQLKSENGDHWEVGCFNGTSKLGDHEYVLEPCDAKVWDPAYLTCRKNKVDFLPTCNMIEEVFGKDSWNNYKARDGKNLS